MCVRAPRLNGLAEVPFKLSCKDYSPHGMAMALKNCSLTSGAGSPGLEEVLASPSLRTFPLDNKLEGQPGSLTHSTLWRKLWHLFESFSRGLPPFAYFVVQTLFSSFSSSSKALLLLGGRVGENIVRCLLKLID